VKDSLRRKISKKARGLFNISAKEFRRKKRPNDFTRATSMFLNSMTATISMARPTRTKPAILTIPAILTVKFISPHAPSGLWPNGYPGGRGTQLQLRVYRQTISVYLWGTKNCCGFILSKDSRFGSWPLLVMSGETEATPYKIDRGD